jgi:hypothetical protein
MIKSFQFDLVYQFPHNLNSVCYISINFAGICLKVQHSYSLGELSPLFSKRKKMEKMKKKKAKKEKIRRRRRRK